MTILPEKFNYTLIKLHIIKINVTFNDKIRRLYGNTLKYAVIMNIEAVSAAKKFSTGLLM